MTASIGFISVRQHTEHGYFGGYLITNQIARPLEFHCTMPVKPSRAQALLYGPTLDDFVCGEQIAKALTMKAKLKPKLLLTDSPAVLAVSLVTQSVCAFLASTHERTASQHLRIPCGNAGQLVCLEFASYSLQFPAGASIKQADIEHELTQLADNFDLSEPFQRIEEALIEAHPIAKAA